MKRVLHITAHMGGGVGKVLSGLAVAAQLNKSEFQHKMLLLEEPEKVNFVDECRKNQVEVEIATGQWQIEKEMAEADIVQLEWWHHPKMLPFLADFPQIPARLLIWSHISGCFYPWIPGGFLQIPDRFVFTSRYSYENPHWQLADQQYARQQCQMVNSSGGFHHIRTERRLHEGFNVGYIGTQSYAKIHPEFVSFCKSVADLPGVRFPLVGDMTNREAILSAAEKMQIASQFEFIDYVTDVSAEFSRFDVFGYVLNPTHFGTTENVLLEAMAAGLPVVCLKQCAEKHLVQHGKTGLLVKNIEEYRQAIYFLYNHPEERVRLGGNARRFVLEEFAAEKTILALQQIYGEMIDKRKKIYSFTAVFGKEPHQWFLSCLPPGVKDFFLANMPRREEEHGGIMRFDQLPYILKEKNKSSIEHFYRNYPKDALLAYWNGLRNEF